MSGALVHYCSYRYIISEFLICPSSIWGSYELSRRLQYDASDHYDTLPAATAVHEWSAGVA
jgi:hypothetical protein